MSYKRRLLGSAAFGFVLFVVLGVRLAYLQINQHAYYTRMAAREATLVNLAHRRKARALALFDQRMMRLISQRTQHASVQTLVASPVPGAAFPHRNRFAGAGYLGLSPFSSAWQHAHYLISKELRGLPRLPPMPRALFALPDRERRRFTDWA